MRHKGPSNPSAKNDPIKLFPAFLITSGHFWQDVAEIMAREVVTIAPDETVLAAAQKMSANAISCLVVSEGDRPIGILTERDFLKRAMSEGKSFDAIRVADVMSQSLVSVPSNLSVFDASRIMHDKQIKRLPVVDKGKLVGIITQTDVIRVLTFYGVLRNVSEIMSPRVETLSCGEKVLKAVQIMAQRNISCVAVMKGKEAAGVFTERDLFNRVIAQNGNAAEIRIEEVMSSPVLSVPPGFSVFSATKLMEKKRIRRLLVIEEGRLHGIVTETDIFRTIKKKAENEEEEHLRQWERSESCVFAFDKDGKTHFVNGAFLRLLEIPEAAGIVGQPFLPERYWCVPEDRGRFLKELSQKDGVGSQELMLKTSAGRIVYAIFFSTCIRNLHGETSGCQGILRDITAEKELMASHVTEMQLRASEQKYKDLSEGLSDVVIRISPLGILEYCSPAIREFGGYDPEAEIGSHISKYFSDAGQLIDTLALLKTVVMDRKSAAMEFLYKPKEGDPFYVEVSGKPLVEDGQVKTIQCVLRNVSGRKRMEETLRESEEKFKSITAMAQDAIIIMSEAGDIEYWNRAAEKIFGYAAQEIVGQKLHPFLAPGRYQEDFNKGLERFARSGAGPVIGKTLEMTAHRKDGTEFPVELSISAVNMKGRWQAIGIVRDITARKQAEDALNKQREEQQVILDSIPAIVFFKDKENRLVRVNKAFAEMMGMPAVVLEGKSCFDLWPAEAAKYWKDDLEVIESKRPKRNIVEPMVAANGLRWVQTDKIPYRDEQGNVAGVIAFTLDITERKQAEEERQRAVDEIHDLYNNAPCGYHSLDGDGVFVRINDTELSWLGYSRDEVIDKKNLRDFLTPKSQELFWAAYDEFKSRGWAQDLEFELVRRDGTILPVLLNATAVKDAAGNFIRSRSTMFDITGRKKDAENLRASEEKYRTIFENSAVGILVADAADRMISWNRCAEALLGMNREDLYLRPVRSIYPEEEWAKLRTLDLKSTALGSHIETKIRKKDSRTVDVDLSLSVLTDQEGKTTGTLAILSDITERKRLETLKNEFVSTVSHELKTPLAILRESISQFHDGILGGVSPDQKRFLGISLRSIDRLSRIVEDLLNISKIEAGRIGLRYELSNLAGVAKNVALHFQAKCRAKGIEIRENFPNDWVEIYIDRDKMAQVFMNLIDNAIKFTEKGFVEISVVDKKDSVECSIVDTGVGIREEDKRKLFVKFQQVGRISGHDDQGTGLGLAITKGIVELHRGKIWVESGPDTGTKVVFTLPNTRARRLFIENVQASLRGIVDSNGVLSVIVFDVPVERGLPAPIAPDQRDHIRRQLEDYFQRQLIRDANISVDESGMILAVLSDLNKTEATLHGVRMAEIIGGWFSGLTGQAGEIKPAFRIVGFPEDGKSIDQLLAKVGI